MRTEQSAEADRPKPNAGWQRSIGLPLVLAFAGAMVVAIWLAVVARVNERERDALESANRNLTNLSLAFDEGLAQSLNAIDQAIMAVRANYQRAGLSAEVKNLIGILGRTNPLVVSFGIADANGDLLFAMNESPGPAERIDVSGRPYFQAHREPGPDRLFVGQPSIGRFTGKWVVFLSRRIAGADGGFGGVVIAGIDAIKLGDFYNKVDLGPQGTVAVIGLDGIARVRVGAMGSVRFGDDFGSAPALKLAAAAPAGTYRFTSLIDGWERVFSYRSMQGVPLIVIAGTAVSDILREPARSARNAYLVGGVLTLSILAVTGLIQLYLQLRRRRERELVHQAALLNVVFTSLNEGICVFDRDLRLSRWNERFADHVGLDSAALHAGMPLRDVLMSQARAGEFGACDPEAEADRRIATLWPDHPVVAERTRPNGRTIELRRSPIPGGGHVTVYIDATERKANERALGEYRRLLSTVLETMRQGFWYGDAEARAIDINPAMCAILGRSRGDIIGRPSSDFVDGEDAEILRSQLYRRRHGSAEPYEIAITRPDGTKVPCICTPTPLHDRNGVYLGSVGMWTDITELKNAQREMRELNATLEHRVEERTAALAASERRLARAQAIAKVGHWVWTGPASAAWAEGKFEFSAAAAAIFGVAPVELTGSDAEYTARFVHPDDRERVDAAFADHETLRRTGARLEYRIRHSNGTYRSIVEIVEVVDGDRSERIEVIGTVHDVTLLKEAESELSVLRANMSDAIESINHAILLYDRDDRLVVFNRHVADHFPAAADTIKVGFRFEHIFGEAVERGAVVVPPGQDKASFIAERVAQHKLADGQIIVRHLADGRIIHVSERRSRNGGIVAVGVDVTAQLRTEQQLREAQKMEAIGKLTGGLAHDFNNYIGVVIGNLDMIQENAANDPGTLSLVEAALNGATRAADLTRSLLAFARRQPLAPKVVDAAACVGDTVRLLRRTLGEQVEIGFEAEPGLWSIEVDQDQLSSSIVNLANNARDAMPRGGSLAVALRNLTVTDDAAANYPDIAPGAYVVIEVSDTGAGMAPETLASAFEPFFTTKGPGHGTGLGLSMVYGFVKQSGGHVAIYSEVGRGTVVRIYLPRAATPGAAVAPTSVGSDVLPRGAETVLIVEDNDSVRTTVARQLADLGYRTIQAASADAALAILRQAGETVDLLFTDMIMPGQMDGYALARAAVAGRPGLKVLLTSGFPGSTLDTAGRLSASFRLLSKPYRKAELARAIRFVLDAAPPAIH